MAHTGLRLSSKGRRGLREDRTSTDYRRQDCTGRTRQNLHKARLPIASANSLDLLCSLLEASENECRVRTAETETVRERIFYKRLARFVRHIIQVAVRVGSVVVDRRGQLPAVDGEHGEDGLYSARRAEQMTRLDFVELNANL